MIRLSYVLTTTFWFSSGQQFKFIVIASIFSYFLSHFKSLVPEMYVNAKSMDFFHKHLLISDSQKRRIRQIYTIWIMLNNDAPNSRPNAPPIDTSTSKGDKMTFRMYRMLGVFKMLTVIVPTWFPVWDSIILNGTKSKVYE